VYPVLPAHEYDKLLCTDQMLNLNKGEDLKDIVGKGTEYAPGYDDLLVDPQKAGGKGDALVPKIDLPNPGEVVKKVKPKHVQVLRNPGEVVKK
jgi:hypothetical protein